MRLVFLHKILFSDMILWFSVAGSQVAESWLSCGDSYGVWFSCGAGFPFARGVFNWDGVFLWGFPHGSEFCLSWAFPTWWSFPKEVLYVMLASVESNNRVYYSTSIHCRNSDFLIG